MTLGIYVNSISFNSTILLPAWEHFDYMALSCGICCLIRRNTPKILAYLRETLLKVATAYNIITWGISITSSDTYIQHLRISLFVGILFGHMIAFYCILYTSFIWPIIDFITFYTLWFCLKMFAPVVFKVNWLEYMNCYKDNYHG